MKKKMLHEYTLKQLLIEKQNLNETWFSDSLVQDIKGSRPEGGVLQLTPDEENIFDEGLTDDAWDQLHKELGPEQTEEARRQIEEAEQRSADISEIARQVKKEGISKLMVENYYIAGRKALSTEELLEDLEGMQASLRYCAQMEDLAKVCLTSILFIASSPAWSWIGTWLVALITAKAAFVAPALIIGIACLTIGKAAIAKMSLLITGSKYLKGKGADVHQNPRISALIGFHPTVDGIIGAQGWYTIQDELRKADYKNSLWTMKSFQDFAVEFATNCSPGDKGTVQGIPCSDLFDLEPEHRQFVDWSRFAKEHSSFLEQAKGALETGFPRWYHSLLTTSGAEEIIEIAPSQAQE